MPNVDSLLSFWVANGGSNSFTKLGADGAKSGTFAVGPEPFGLAFDGSNIWVANSEFNQVTNLRASDGKVSDTFQIDALDPMTLAFDDANIWIADADGFATKLRASDEKMIGNFSAAMSLWHSF